MDPTPLIRAWRRFRSGWSGGFRYGAVIGGLFVLSVQACSAELAENRSNYEERLRDYEAMLGDDERLEREWQHWRRWMNSNPALAGLPTDKETFIRERHPVSSASPVGWFGPLSIALGGILLFRSFPVDAVSE